MTLLEDINSGKYNLVLILILFVLVFYQYQSKIILKENMTDIDSETIQQLSDIAKQLKSGNLSISGNLNVDGLVKVKKSLIVGSKDDTDGQVELINKKGGRGVLLTADIYNKGGSLYLYSPNNLVNEYNYKNHIHYDESTIEVAPTADVVKEAIKQVYNADVEAIRNLSEVATKLQAGGLTIPGNLTVTGSVTVGSKNGVDGSISLINKQGGPGMLLASNIYDQGGSIYLYAPANPEGQYNYKNHIHYNSSTLVIPGMILAWTGATPPDGWALCDGANGTPDLRGRFVLGLGKVDNTDNNYTGFGAKSYERSYGFNINETGGENKHTLDTNEMPAHSHQHNDSYFSESWGNDTSYGTELAGSGKSDNDNRLYTINDRVTSNTGGSQPHNNMPPYYVLAYIMKL